MTTTEDEFNQLIDANPSDWQTRLVFADWLQEQGDPRWRGYYALGVLRVEPLLVESSTNYWTYHEGRGYYPEKFTYDQYAPVRYALPCEWFRGFDAAYWIYGDSRYITGDLSTRRSAEEVAVEVFLSLPPDVQEQIMRCEVTYPEGVAPPEHLVQPEHLAPPERLRPEGTLDTPVKVDSKVVVEGLRLHHRKSRKRTKKNTQPTQLKGE